MWWKGTSHIERSHEWDYEINKVIAFVFPIVGSNGAWLLRDCIEWKCHCEIFGDTRRTLLEWLTGWGWRTTYILFICLVREGSCGSWLCFRKKMMLSRHSYWLWVFCCCYNVLLYLNCTFPWLSDIHKTKEALSVKHNLLLIWCIVDIV